MGCGGGAGQEAQVMDPQGAGLVFRKYARVPVPRDHSAALSGSLGGGHAGFSEKVKCEEKMHYVGRGERTPQTK